MPCIKHTCHSRANTSAKATQTHVPQLRACKRRGDEIGGWLKSMAAHLGDLQFEVDAKNDEVVYWRNMAEIFRVQCDGLRERWIQDHESTIWVASHTLGGDGVPC